MEGINGIILLKSLNDFNNMTREDVNKNNSIEEV